MRHNVTMQPSVKLSSDLSLSDMFPPWLYGPQAPCVHLGHSRMDHVSSEVNPLDTGLGLAAVSGSSEPKLAVIVKKKLALLDGSQTILSAKLQADANVNGTNVGTSLTT